MARKTISEYQAKKLLFPLLGFSYSGMQVNTDLSVNSLDSSKNYIVKVDEGVKKRFKKGQVKLNVSANEIQEFIKEFQEKGYHQFLIEEFVPHDQSEEKYLAVERVRDGFQVLYSPQGGVDIEENTDTIQKSIVKNGYDTKDVVDALDLPQDFIKVLLQACDRFHFSFLEINPLVVQNNEVYILDVAAEVDTAGEFFAKEWSSAHFTHGSKQQKTEEEKIIDDLSETSPASLKYEIINPNGSIFLLLSGGGASIVIADEVYQQGYGKELANYGEYSGNPTEEETYLYTKQLLNSLLKSNATKKILIIGGGVANFTDIRKTFLGIIRALREVKQELKEQQVKVFVRRGGPHQKEGLAHMEEFLRLADLYGDVSGPEKMLTSVVDKALEYLKP